MQCRKHDRRNMMHQVCVLSFVETFIAHVRSKTGFSICSQQQTACIDRFALFASPCQLWTVNAFLQDASIGLSQQVVGARVDKGWDSYILCSITTRCIRSRLRRQLRPFYLAKNAREPATPRMLARCARCAVCLFLFFWFSGQPQGLPKID